MNSSPSPSPTRLLMIEDCEDDALLVVNELQRQGFAVEYQCVTDATGLRVALVHSWDLIIADFSLPQFGALEALRITREAGVDAPFIVVSGSIGDEAAVAVMKAGAHDYIMKDRLARLGPAIERELREAAGRAQRRSVERQLRRSEERLRIMFNHSPDAWYLYDLEGRFVDANATAEAMVGRARSELIGKSFAESQLLSLADLERAQRALLAARSGRPTEPMDLHLHRPDGSTVIVEARSYPVVVDHQPLMLGVARDVTERVRAQRRLANLNECLLQFGSEVDANIHRLLTLCATEFRACVAAFYRKRPDTPQRVVASDAEGIPAWLETTEHVWQPLINEPSQAAQVVQRPGASADPDGAAAAGPAENWFTAVGRTVAFHTTTVGALVLYYTAPHHPDDHDLRLLDLIAAAVAVEERRGQAEAERLRLEDELRQAHKMEAVGQLAGGVAHDFNNILQSIQGHTDLVRADIDPQHGAQASLTEILRSVERASTLVQQLLTFSRREKPETRLLDLNTLIAGLTNMLSRVLGEHIRLSFAAGDNLPLIQADPRQLEQALLNLCINARDAMTRGGQLALRTARSTFDADFVYAQPWARPGTFASVVISDTGPGMPPEVRAHIFEPFFTTKRCCGGSGLGLASVYGIVQQHSGLIHCDTAPNRGTTFALYFPAADAAAAPPPATSADDSPRRSPPADRPPTILLAEDEAQVRTLAARILERSGFDVIAAEDGEEALALFKAQPERIDLALLDVVMPKANGPDAGEAMRLLRSDLPILFTTGYDQNQLALAESIDAKTDLLHKPYRPETLLQKIRQKLGWDRTGAAPANSP